MATQPPNTLPEISIDKLTTGDFNGTGVIDRLMFAVHSYIDHEFKETRIKGPEYAAICTSLINTAIEQGAAFLLQQQKAVLEAQLIEAQIRLADKQVEIADKELAIKEVELTIRQAELPKIQAEISLINAQADKTQKETLNVAKEMDILIAQECKLKAEYDLLAQNTLKAAQEILLLAQKVETEKAQTLSTGVDPDSVIGRQKALYLAQADGFKRDAEQKAAKIMVDTFNVRRTTDSATQANADNMLQDTDIGRAINQLLTGVGA